MTTQAPEKPEKATQPKASNRILPKRLVQGLAGYHAPLEGRRGATRLDFNENTIGFPQHYPTGLPVESFTVYPEYQSLLEQLAALYQVPIASLMLTNGSDEALFVIPNTFLEPGEDVALHCSPTFPMIIHDLRLSGATLTEISLTTDLTYPVEEIEAALKQQFHKLVILASPDNPTGAVMDKATVLRWCQQFPDTLFVIDEAYSEYEGPGFTLLHEVERTPNLMVTRTFSKAWGLAGCRLGFVVAHPELVGYMKRVRSPYSVNQLAVETALNLLPNAGDVMKSARQAKERRNELIATLKKRGYNVRAGGGNFFLLELGLAAKPFERFLAKRRILVRDRSSHPLLVGTVRVSVGSQGENELFLQALTDFEKTTALVFDLDDTLVDTSESFDVTVAFLIRKFSDVPLGQNELQKLRLEGGYNDDWLATQELLKRRGVEMTYEAIAQEGTRVYLNLAEEAETPLMDWANLTRLAQRYRLFIITGRHRQEYDKVWAERLNPYFEQVLCCDDVAGLKAKPSSDYFHHLRDKHQLETCFYIGNSVDDMTSATGANFMPLGITKTVDAETLTQQGALRCYPTADNLPEAFAL